MRLERVCGKDSIPLWRFKKAFYFQSDAYFNILSLCRGETFLTVFWQRKKRQSCEWRVFVDISHWNSWICQFLNLDLLIFPLFTIKVRIYHKQRIPNDLVIWACIPKFFFYWAGTHFKLKRKNSQIQNILEKTTYLLSIQSMCAMCKYSIHPFTCCKCDKTESSENKVCFKMKTWKFMQTNECKH